MPLDIDQTLVDAVRRIALEAGARILEIYASDFAIQAKEDRSPVTDADKAAEALIIEALETKVAGRLTGDFPIIAEESVAAGRIPEIEDGPFWVVDPLDGTKEFIKRNGEFTVNIALIARGRPVLGVVHAPAIGQTYWGSRLGAFAETGGRPKPIATRPAPEDGYVVMGSRSHRSPADDAFLKDFVVADMIAAGSSLKFCRVAEGVADLYVRLGRTMEWDTGAGHAVLLAAGGRVTIPGGGPLAYGKPAFANDSGFVAWGR